MGKEVWCLVHDGGRLSAGKPVIVDPGQRLQPCVRCLNIRILHRVLRFVRRPADPETQNRPHSRDAIDLIHPRNVIWLFFIAIESWHDACSASGKQEESKRREQPQGRTHSGIAKQQTHSNEGHDQTHSEKTEESQGPGFRTGRARDHRDRDD
jgi:hypothetical protein